MFLYELSDCEFKSHCSHFDIQETADCRFTLKRVNNTLSLLFLLLTLLINSNKRINRHKIRFDILRSADRSDNLSLKVFNALESVEKTMIQGQVSNYTLPRICLNRYKSYFKFALMLAVDINLN